MKTYVVTISANFPTTHKRKGEPTNFYPLILRGLKKHTIRGNYELWKRRFDKINSGDACLSIRHWDGKPYNSTQTELLRFTKDDGIGIEKIEDPTNFVFAQIEGKIINWDEVASNDGLYFDDFCEWFKVRSNKPMAIIHFTNFRYSK